MGKHSTHRWWLVDFSVSGLAQHLEDVSELEGRVLSRTGLGIASVTKSSPQEAVVTALFAGRPKDTTLHPAPRECSLCDQAPHPVMLTLSSCA
jgi:hypothetical protein